MRYGRFLIIVQLMFLMAACGGDAGNEGSQRDTDKIITGSGEEIHDVNSKDEENRDPLHYAALRGQKETARLLVKKGADINAKDRYNFTPLHYAARRGHRAVVSLLLSKRVQVNVRDHYECTPLHHAAEKGYTKIVEMLVEAGADLEAKDKNDQKAENLAIEEGYLEMAELLNPLNIAIKTGDLAGVKVVHQKNPRQINAKDWAGRIPLHRAYRYDQKAIIEYLAAQGAQINEKDNYGYAPSYYSAEERTKRSGINLLDPSLIEKIDNQVYNKLKDYFFVNVGIVNEGKVAFTKFYGKSRINKDYVYASVSKPVTAMIIMQLLAEGKIRSLDDNIRKYSPRYKNCMPQKYADASLTIKHLLMYRSGVPHNNEPTWKNGKLNLKFKPGEKEMYSTPGYGILGHVIEDATGLSFDQAVKKYIGQPVGASSFWAEKVFKAPGARVHSTIKDMALFVSGLINHKYFSENILYNQVLQHHRDGIGIGWPCKNLGTPDITAYASGSNGYPQAYIIFKPRKKFAVVLLARAKDRHSFELNKLGADLLSAIEMAE